jgi:hypothetical protein
LQFALLRSAFYFALLAVVKFLRCVGIFTIDILSRSIHVVSLLWLFKIM